MRRLGWSALLFLGTIAAAQPRTHETIEVSIVNVDVVVTDRKGNRITGLTQNDFEIREGGKVQPITNFAEYTSAAAGTASIEAGPAQADAPAAVAARPKRNVVVFVESVRLLPPQAKQMFDSVRSLLRETVQRGDRATIITWRSAVLVRQPFTDDLPALERVLAELETEAVHGPRDLAAQVRREQAASDGDAAAAGSGSGMPPVHLLEAARRQLYDIKQKTHVLEALMQSISALDGRKIVVMAMRRFGVHAGAEYFGGEVPMDYRRELDTTPLRDRLIRTANAQGVTLYPVYPTGLRWEPDDASTYRDIDSIGSSDLERGAMQNKIMLNETLALGDLADKTGGLFAWGSANIAELLPRVADDLETYYSLGYRSRATGKDVSRNIVVTVKNRDYVVRSRRHYVEKSDRTVMSDRVVANLYQRLDGTSVAFEAGFGPIKSAGRRKWTLPLRLRIPIAALTTLPQGPNDVGEFSVYVVTGAVVGVVSEVQHRSQPFRIPRNDAEKAKASFFTYDFTLEIDEKVDRVSVGLLDETSKEFGLKRLAIPERPAK